MSLFDTQNLCEISPGEYPGERLVACFVVAGANGESRADQMERSARASPNWSAAKLALCIPYYRLDCKMKGQAAETSFENRFS
jgi:hypothetical protein